MNIQFQTITIKNFRSFLGQGQTLDFFSLPIGVCFLRGENEVEESLGANGSGKTTIWNALSWCLFGKTPDGLRNPDIIPWVLKKSPYVFVSLIIDKKPYAIKRTANPNTLTINDKDASQAKVEKLLGLNFETFTHTVLFGQDRDLFFDLSASDKLGLFTDALDLNRWDERSQHASTEVRNLEMKQVAADRDLVAAKAQVTRTKELLAKAKEQSSTFEENRLADVEKLNAEIKKLLAARESAMIKRGSASLVEDGALTEKDALDREFRSLYDELFVLRDGLSTGEAKVEQIRKRVIELNREIDGLGELDNCPTCGQSLEGTSLLEHKKKLKAKVKKLFQESHDLGLQTLEKKYAAQEKKVERVRPNLVAKEQLAKKARSEIDVWDKRLAEILVNLHATKRQLTQLEGAENPYHSQVADHRRYMTKYRAIVEEIAEEIKKCAARLERTKFWVRGFKDVRLFILQEILAELQLATNSMLGDVGLHDWEIEYDIEQETKSGTTKRGLVVKVLSSHNTTPVRWECWSGGERQRLRLVGAMALSEVLLSYAGVTVDLEIFDEPTRSLSEGGIRDLCEFLHTRARDLKKRIWYTDHHTTESSLFSAVVTVRKTKDCGSRIFTT